MKKYLFSLALMIVVIGAPADLFGQKKAKLADYFEETGKWLIDIPPNFSLANFYEENKDSFYYFNKGIIEGTFVLSHPLYTGREYVFICRLKQTMTSQQCLKFISKQKGMPSNAQRLLIAWKQLKLDTLIKKDVCVFGLDNKENLWFNHGCYQTAFIYKGIFNRLICNLSCFEDEIPAGSYIVFTKRKKK